MIAEGLTALQSTGLLEDVAVPELSASGDPDEQRAALAADLGRELPIALGELVVYRSDRVQGAAESVQTAQRLLVVAKRAVWVLAVASVVLVASTIVVSARRWRAVLVLALGTAAAMVLIRSAVRGVVSGRATWRCSRGPRQRSGRSSATRRPA